MRYYKVKFNIQPYSGDFADVLSAVIAEVGFETFEPDETGLCAYIQQGLYDESALRQSLLDFPIPGVQITYTAEEAPNQDWNEQWEQEGFRPIIIDDLIAVHDVRHTDIPPVQYDIRIQPRQAFGTGSHQTTRMILRQLSQMDLNGHRVVDAGTGTGILAIMALMRGASHVFAYDIDEWSVDNAKDNIRLNPVEAERCQILLGDSSVLEGEQDADLLIANINRNILLGDLPRFRKTLRNGGQLLISGFYRQDVPSLCQAAKALGLELKSEQHDEEWTMLLFKADTTGGMDI